MGLAAYDVQGSGKSWAIFHNGKPEGDYETAEAAFEAAVAAASLALREGHEVRVTVGQRETAHVAPLSSLTPRSTPDGQAAH
jgi:hypothetical protein